MNKAERQSEIISILRIQKYEKIDNLACQFGVSARTIKNDILDLTCNYPLYTKQGRYDGGVYWDIYHTWNNETNEEIALLKSLKTYLKSEKEKSIINRVIKKISKA